MLCLSSLNISRSHQPHTSNLLAASYNISRAQRISNLFWVEKNLYPLTRMLIGHLNFIVIPSLDSHSLLALAQIRGAPRSNRSSLSQVPNRNMLLSLKRRRISFGLVNFSLKLVLFLLLLLNFLSILPVIIKAQSLFPKIQLFMHVPNILMFIFILFVNALQWNTFLYITYLLVI